jgi:hypothetical protein
MVSTPTLRYSSCASGEEIMRRFVLAAAALLLATSSAWSQEKLILVTVSPAGGDNSIHYAAWGKKVTAESQGTLDIDVRDGIALASF